MLPDIRFLEERREVSFDWHITHATKWLAYDAGRMLDSVLVYCALDLRIAIERYVFELLIHFYDYTVSEKDEKESRDAGYVFGILKKKFPDIEKRLEFASIVLSVISSTAVQPSLPDISRLSRWLGDLSDYLHKQMRPERGSFLLADDTKAIGFQLVKEVLQYFRFLIDNSFGSPMMPIEKMPAEVQDMYEKFRDNELNHRQVEVRLKLMQPVLEQRIGQSILIKTVG